MIDRDVEANIEIYMNLKIDERQGTKDQPDEVINTNIDSL